MKRLILIIAAAVLAAVSAGAQTPLPNDPAVKTGKLANGMTYYILHNDLPKQRAEFYLITNVGAIQETPDQDGLAHFLEHMCFNGLKNLPGKQMLEYLQHIGAEFGRNINASTGVERTVYMLNNIPVIREGIIDTCLLVMHDYSHFVLNEQKEIDDERGVILEEKRTRNSAQWRMFEQSLPYYFGDSKYSTCTIFGSEENLKTFKRESLVNFYEKWYQPDMQALVVIGDIDPDQILAKAEKLFADIPAPATPTVKELPAVALNDEPVIGILTDPENTATYYDVIWKTGEPTPKAINGTDVGYFERLFNVIVRRVMRERFSDISSKVDSPFIGASFTNDQITLTCDSYTGSVTVENAKALSALEAFLIEIEKMRRYGFSDDEINRVKDDIIKGLNDAVAAKATRENYEFIQPIVYNFLDGKPYMTPEVKLQVTQAILSQMNAQVVNSILSKAFTGEHQTIMYYGVDKPGMVHPTKEQVLSIIDKVKNADIPAPVFEKISSDFMAGKTIKAGKVKKETKGLYGSTVWTMKNGLKVVVLPTDYKKDQVLLYTTKDGGLSTVPTEDFASFDDNLIDVVQSNSGVSSFSGTTVAKMLSGKTVRVSPYFGTSTSGVNCACSPEDVETALQLVNLYYTDPRFDKEEWDVSINQLGSFLPNLETTPRYAFSQHIYKDRFNDNPRMSLISQEILNNAKQETYEKGYRRLLADVNGATMYIVGNVEPNSIKPLVEKYLGSIKKAGKPTSVNRENIVLQVPGQKIDVFKAKMESPKASVGQFFSASPEFSIAKMLNAYAAEFILDMIYTETLREEEGGTYSVTTVIRMNGFPVNEATISIYFDTNVQQQEKLRELAVSGLKKLTQNGPTEEQLLRAVENAKKNLPEKRITNSYWRGALMNSNRYGIDYDAEYEKAVNNISAQGIKDILNEILATGNFVEVVMLPEE